jgi:hypothetical protein
MKAIYGSGGHQAGTVGNARPFGVRRGRDLDHGFGYGRYARKNRIELVSGHCGMISLNRLVAPPDQ